MPSPSADRPPALPQDPFTEDDVALVDDVIDTWWTEKMLDVWPDFEPAARLVLTALAAAGRLLPPDADRVEEWAMRYTLNGDPKPPEWGGHVFDSREEAERHITAWRSHYPNLTYTDVVYMRRDVLTGPWVEVDPDA